MGAKRTARSHVVGPTGILSVVLCLGACGGAPDGTVTQETHTTRDSAGVQILEVGPVTHEWRLSDQPIVRLGLVDGDPAHLLSQVQFAGRLADGRIVVANGADQQVRYFASDGRHLTTVGHPGQGPGEFMAFGNVMMGPGDTIWIRDSRIARITVISPSAEVVRQYSVARLDQGTSLRLLGPLGSERIVATTLASPLLPPDRGPGPVYFRDTVTISVVDLTTMEGVALATLPAQERFVPAMDSPDAGRFRIPVLLPYGHDAVYAILGEGVVFGTSEYPELRLTDDTGVVTRILRLNRTPTALTTSLRQRDLEWTLENATARNRPDPAADAQAQGSRLDMVPDGHVVPLFDDLLTDAAGRIWLREYRYRWEGSDPQVWSIYEQHGPPVARVELPGALSVMHVGGGHVTGVMRDDLGVEYVVVYHIHEGS